MKLRILVLALAAAAVSVPARAQDSPEKAAQAAAEKWLAVVDAGNYGQAWDEAASAFKAALTKEQWIDAVGKARGVFGKLESRKALGARLVHELPKAPPGDYVVLHYEAKFPGVAADEIITPMKEADGAWKVSGYYILNKKQP